MTLDDICAQLQDLQRGRATLMKTRNMHDNRLRSIVATTSFGFHAGMAEKDREKAFKQTKALIRRVNKGEAHRHAIIIRATKVATAAYLKEQRGIEKEMVKLVRQMPKAIVEWASGVRGFGTTTLVFLGVVVGECGNFFNYPNPAKIWRRMGLAPWTYNGVTAMGSTWRSGKQGKLPAAEWEEYGYSPRRRSIAFLIGDNMMKQNFLDPTGGGGQTPDDDVTAVAAGPYPTEVVVGDGDDEVFIGDLGLDPAGDGEDARDTVPDGAVPGPYRAWYDLARAKAAVAHPDWKPGRLHNHGRLIAAKRVLLDLWRVWHGFEPKGGPGDAPAHDTESSCVAEAAL